jgi:hypothetical protein
MYFHPGEEGWAKIEADTGIVADDPHDAAITVQIPCGCIGGITLGSDPFIPVMIGIGRILDLYGLKPGVFAGWLVKVAMYAEESFHHYSFL